jgi:hypothetical protein
MVATGAPEPRTDAKDELKSERSKTIALNLLKKHDAIPIILSPGPTHIDGFIGIVDLCRYARI